MGMESKGFKTVATDFYKGLLEERYNLQYIDKKGEKIHVTELEDRSVTEDDLEEMYMNSYAREELPPKLTNKALIETALRYKDQCSAPRYPSSTYNDALIHTVLPELIKRLKEIDELGELGELEKLGKKKESKGTLDYF